MVSSSVFWVVSDSGTVMLIGVMSYLLEFTRIYARVVHLYGGFDENVAPRDCLPCFEPWPKALPGVLLPKRTGASTNPAEPFASTKGTVALTLINGPESRTLNFAGTSTRWALPRACAFIALR
jgi:hypothetical protein